MKKLLVVLFFIIVFGFPIGWYLFLQTYGENQFELPVMGVWESSCVAEPPFVYLNSSNFTNHKNEVNRIKQRIGKDALVNIFQTNVDTCGLESEIYLVDGQSMIRGAFDLEREEVDRLFAEIDIFILNQNKALTNEE